MKKLQLKKILSSSALIVGMIPLAGFAETYIPAKFDFDSSDLAALVKVDSNALVDNAVAVYCQSDIDTDGEALRVSCYDEHAGDLEVQTEQQITKLAFTPAKVDGEAIPVRMRFRVIYDDAAGDLSATVLPNIGTMQAKYGAFYVAPQERLDFTSWYSRYSEYSLIAGGDFLAGGEQTRVGAIIDKKGNAKNVSSVHAKREYKRDVTIVKNALRKSEFIPGFVNEQPVPMNYMAVIDYNSNSQEAVSKR